VSPRFSLRLLAAQSDERLAELVREGHERAFEALANRYRRRLLRYCRHLGLPDSGGEDVVQQALLQAWLALGRGVEVRHIKAWLYRIVHNAAVNSRRAAVTRQARLEEQRHGQAALGHVTDLEGAVAARQALNEMAALPVMQRQAIVLTALEGQSHEEAAGTLGISSAALRGLVYRARSSLRSAAAALIPHPLVAWAAGGADGGVPTAQRLAQLTGAGASSSVTAVLLKGGAAAVTAGVLATSAGVVQLNPAGPSHRSKAAPRRVISRVSPSVARAPSTRPGTSRPLDPASSRGQRRTRGAVLQRRGRRGRGGAGPLEASGVHAAGPASGEGERLRRGGESGPQPTRHGGDLTADDRLVSATSSGPSSSSGPAAPSSSGPGPGDGSGSQSSVSSSGPGPGVDSGGSGGGTDGARSDPAEAIIALSDGRGSSGPA